MFRQKEIIIWVKISIFSTLIVKFNNRQKTITLVAKFTSLNEKHFSSIIWFDFLSF